MKLMKGELQWCGGKEHGAYERLSGHLARPVLGWLAQVEYPVPKHCTFQAVRSGF